MVCDWEYPSFLLLRSPRNKRKSAKHKEEREEEREGSKCPSRFSRRLPSSLLYPYPFPSPSPSLLVLLLLLRSPQAQSTTRRKGRRREKQVPSSFSHRLPSSLLSLPLYLPFSFSFSLLPSLQALLKEGIPRRFLSLSLLPSPPFKLLLRSPRNKKKLNEVLFSPSLYW